MWKFHCKGNMDFSFIFICRVSCSGRLISGRVLCSSSPPHADYPSVLLDLPMGYMPTASTPSPPANARRRLRASRLQRCIPRFP